MPVGVDEARDHDRGPVVADRSLVARGISLAGGGEQGADGFKQTELSTYLGLAAVIFATVNVVGGYMVTHRMLAMFRKKD